jgi:glycosyltransferase involved in cell wall biosynthesis
MKIVYVITKASPFGGAQKYVLDLAPRAQAAGFDVAVAHGGAGPFVEALNKAGVRTISIPGLVRDVGGSDITAFFALLTVVRRERPDILHLNSSKVGAMGALIGRLCGVKKIIYTDHGWAFMEKRPLFQRSIIWLISWFTTLLCHKIIVVSDFERTLTEKLPLSKHKVVRIYNGVDLSMQFGSGDSIRSAFPKGVTITGTVGELTKNKNQISLIEEARKNPSMYVAIVGEGDLRPYLEEKIREYKLSDRVKLFGYIPARDVLKGFDVFTLPSNKESLGFSILEARIAGLPVIANRVGGIPEAIDVPLEEFSLPRMIERTLALYTS